MLGKYQQCGFSLIELLVGIVIVSLLFALAAPEVSVWIQNQQTRTAAESILNGLQLARSEAVKNNATARFSLCGMPLASWEVLAASTVPAAPAPSLACGAGSNAGPGEIRIQEHSAQESTLNAVVATNPAGVTSITFNNIGRAVGLAGTLIIGVSNPSNPPADDRPLNVTVGVGGTLRMCDPSPHLPNTDPRHC